MKFEIHNADCLHVMRALESDSVDSIVTDPPYGLSFMSKAWDYSVPSTEIWKEALRVLKPGGHLLAFGGTRTYHRLVVNIEDAGFEIRDQIMWIYGSGFPKSHAIDKHIDKELGAVRETKEMPLNKAGANDDWGQRHGKQANHHMADKYANRTPGETVTVNGDTPVTDEAKQWKGWGTALKPANEPICLARKPLSEKTVAKNVLKHGVGGLNVDASRISVEGVERRSPCRADGTVSRTNANTYGTHKDSVSFDVTQGRFPANILFDEYAAGVLDEQSGVLKSGARKGSSSNSDDRSFKGGSMMQGGKSEASEGGASRFFATFKQDEQCNANTVKLNSNQLSELDVFVAKLVAISERPDTSLSSTLKAFTLETQSELKNVCARSITPMLNTVQKFSQELWRTSMSSNSSASSAEALMLTDTMRTIQSLLMSSSFAEAATSSTTLSETAPGELDLASKFIYVAKASKKDRGEGNTHPTVKPIKLMEYLIKLVTPEGGVVLDPFMGSGTTGVAADGLGFGFVGCEMTKEYYEIAYNRLGFGESVAS